LLQATRKSLTQVKKVLKKAKEMIKIQEDVETKVFNTGKVAKPNVDVWAKDYGVTYSPDTEEDATEES